MLSFSKVRLGCMQAHAHATGHAWPHAGAHAGALLGGCGLGCMLTSHILLGLFCCAAEVARWLLRHHTADWATLSTDQLMPIQKQLNWDDPKNVPRDLYISGQDVQNLRCRASQPLWMIGWLACPASTHAAERACICTMAGMLFVYVRC